ncbi:hypothetical protein [Massilia brevitalea]|nr:hypothetical protein [Massilia brevitalea]
MAFSIAAGAVLLLHLAFVLFVVFGALFLYGWIVLRPLWHKRGRT